MQKKRVCSLITALCITFVSMGAVPKKAAATQTFDTEQVIEAEAGVANGVIYEDDAYASGKTSLFMRNGTASKSEDISLEAMSWLVNLPKKGKYRIFLRGLFLADDTNDFWVGINDEEWTRVSASKDNHYKWYEIAETECSGACIKKIKIHPAEKNGSFDAIYVTSDPDEDFAPPEIEADVPEADSSDEPATEKFEHKQEKIFEVTGSGIQIQAGEGSYTTSAYKPGRDRNAADTDVLKSLLEEKSTPDKSAPAQYKLEFKTQKTANYSIWIRMYAAGSLNDTYYFSFGDGSYSSKSISVGSFKWYKVYTGRMEAGVLQKIRLRSKEALCNIDTILITDLSAFIPTGRYGNLSDNPSLEVEKLNGEKYEKPQVTPPANEHPRVLFRKSDIPRIIENMDTEQNERAKRKLTELLSEEIDRESETYSNENYLRIEANAFDYAINGTKERGIAAKEAMLGILRANSDGSLMPSPVTRTAGYTIYTAAEVYDWCYDLFTKKERNEVISICTNLASAMEIGWPPSAQGASTGHGAEAQLLRDLLSFAIATYDERPDFWEYIGGRYYDDYVPTHNFWTTGIYQGSSYGSYRQMWSNWSYLLIKGMGAEVPIDLEKLADSMLWQIYYRRPDGQMVRDGDISNDSASIWSYWSVKPQGMMNAYLLTDDPMLKYDISRSSSYGIAYYSTGVEYGSIVPFLIYNDPELEPSKSYWELPLSKYFGSPHGIMVARTGWDDGAESPAVVARMKVGEWQSNNHQHLDAGEFQIYYKGALATDSGVYQGLKSNTSTGGTAYGAPHLNQYATKTIAHNCMLVYNPSEGDSSSTARRVINDGGQKAINNGGEYDILSNPSAHVADVEGVEIDPTNPMEPAYSYLKGNLTNAYTDKVTDYKRSFMFLNLKDEKVPAAMIVFDKIDSQNASYKKTWLLHGLEEPEINGRQVVFSRTYHSTKYDFGYNGKLTLDTLLPAKSKIKKVGGEDGWSNVNGIDYTGYPLNSQTDEGSTWRIEISPEVSSKSDCFLNVMQVSDNDKSDYLPVKLLDTKLFYGAKISDRVVMFSKSGERVKEDFDFEIPGDAELQYTVCDVASGTYKVMVGEQTLTVGVTEEGGVLAFKATGGKIAVRRAEGESAPEIAAVEAKSERSDIINVKIDDLFVYNKVSPILENGTILINANEIKRHFGVTEEANGNSLKFSRKEGSIEFILGSSTAYVNSEQIELPTPSIFRDGVWMIPARAAVEALGGSIEWDKYARTVYIELPDQDLSLPAGYVRIVSAADDGSYNPPHEPSHMIDEDTSTLWSAKGIGKYVILELEKECEIGSAEIIFNPNQARNAEFELEVSVDGKKYTNVYTGTADGSVELLSWEKFEFSKPQKAKYVKLIANGSNLSDWNGVMEIRFKLK